MLSIQKMLEVTGPVSLRDWSLIKGRGGGLQNGRGGGHVTFYPYKKGGGAEKVLAMLKGGGGAKSLGVLFTQ